MQATEDLLYYGLPITTDTVRLHHEFVPTSCPHRSLALHGGTTESVKNYFVIRMNELAQLGSTVEEMLSGIGNRTEENEDIHNIQSTTSEEEKPKSNEDIADEVILGLWGNGADRKQRLEKEGYDYEAIQEIVNKKLNE